MANSDDLDLQDLAAGAETKPPPQNGAQEGAPEASAQRAASELEAVFDVLVHVSAVLGKSTMPISQLLALNPGAVLELDRKVGEAIDIYVNNRLVARGEMIIVEDRLGVTMTEIVKSARS